MNEELAIAIEEIRLRGDNKWFIPVLLSGVVPDTPIGRGRTLQDIHFVRLTSDGWSLGVESLCRALGIRTNLNVNDIAPDSVARDRQRSDDDNASEIHRVTGIGQTASEMLDLHSGLWRVSLTHQGNGHFGVWLLDSNGDRVDLLANSGGTFHGTKLVRISQNGRYLCDVSADGKWEIVISPPMQLESTMSIQGRSQAGTDLMNIAGGLRLFALKHDGVGHFGVWLLDGAGKRVELLANASGNFDGSKAVKLRTGAYAFDISADGPWEIAWS